MSRNSKTIKCYIARGVTSALALGLTCTVSLAETRVFGCHFVHKYGSLQANIALAHARKIVGPHEANRLYDQYVGLKNECHSNPEARKTVHLSPELAKLARNY